ncbi:uncharacterized protein LOC141643306 isoform X1 [Silene latifolia]|uniref:uncharacterized protein LOC141643306 isoform X1 n=2 Tax=Silene latifolia TaxID=37657 RepID=UPI003D77E043
MGGLKNDGLKWVNKEGEFRKMNGTTLGSVPKARPVPVNGSNRRSGSDMDLDSGSDDETYGGRYSVESSPQDDKVRRGVERDSYYPTNGGRGATKKADIVRNIHCDASSMLSSRGHSHSSVKSSGGREEKISSNPFQPRLPNFHASGLSPWSSVVSYDACIRLCLTSSAKGCKDASFFLDNECVVLRDAFNLRHALLQSEEEVMSKGSSELISGSAAPKPKKIMGKIKVQVRKVKMGLDPQSGCSFPQMPKLEIERFQYRIKSVKSRLSSGWEAVQRVNAAHHLPKEGSLSHKSLAYMHVGTRYMKDIAGLLRSGLSSSPTTSSLPEVVQEAYSCLIRLKSSSDEDAVRMQPGSGETHIFFPDSLGDDLIIVVSDSKGNRCGCVAAQVALVVDAANDKVRWWPIYKESDHEPIGKIQLYINYLSQDDNSQLKYGIVAETVAYDLVLETAMKAQNFQQRNLLLHGHWRWLVNAFAAFYGVSDAYTKLRYLSYVMDVATPTADCLVLIHDLLSPVITKGTTLSHQEKRILGELSDKIEEILALVFENYKSLDETALSGLADEFKSTGVVAPALAPAIKLYGLQHNIQSPEARLKLCKYFQVAAKTRSRRHLEEMNDSIFNNEGPTIDVVTSTTAYEKMKSSCLSVKNEIYTDIVINNQNVLPSFLDFPNLTSSIYSVELSLRLRTFLKACPPTGPSSPVTDLVITVADFERDLALWYINSIKGGVDAKEIFGSYISNWIKVKNAALIESCKLSAVKGSACKTEQLTNPFIDELYDQLRQTLNEYEVIVHRWPEYAVVLENVMADVQNAAVEALEKQYADVLSPLKDNLARLGLKYVQKFAKRADSYYSVPSELGIVLNSLRRMLDVLFPKIETQLKTWSTCVVDSGNTAPGERLTEVTIMLRTKFRNLTQAVTEKLLENTRLQSATKWKKIIQDFKDISEESDVQSRMQQLQDMVVKTIDHLHSILETRVFVTVCRGFWDRMGQEVLHCLENGKENRSLYKGLRIALRILDETFATEIQRLLGNNVQHKDIEPPRTIVEAHAMLCKDSTSTKDGACYY